MFALVKQYKKELWLALLCLIYLAVDMAFTFNGFYLFNVLPAAILLIYLAFTRLDVIYYAIIAFTPLCQGKFIKSENECVFVYCMVSAVPVSIIYVP